MMLSRYTFRISNIRYIHQTSILHLTKNEYIQKAPLPDRPGSLYEKYKDSILFSSYIEKNKIKLGYKRNQMLHGIIQKRESDRLQIQVQSAPLSVAAQLMDERGAAADGDQSNLDAASMTDDLTVDANKYSLNEKELKFLSSVAKELTEDQAPSRVPLNWFTDYETYDETSPAEDNYFGTPGTASIIITYIVFCLSTIFCIQYIDLNVPISKVPCHGCGALLHCADKSLPGYLPSELFRGQKDDVLTVIFFFASAI